MNDANDSVKALRNRYTVFIMEKKQRIFVYGNTVILDGISTSISLDPDCEVIGHTMAIDQQALCALHPDVVIFDLEAAKPDLHYSLAQELPGLLLIGIDPETNRALLWSGWEAEALSSQDLAQLIHNQGATTRTKKMKGGEDTQ